MSDSLTKWLDRVSIEDANEGVAKPVEDKNVKAVEKPADDATPGVSEASGEAEIKAVAKEDGTEEQEGGPAAGAEEAAPLGAGSDGGANAGEVEGGAAAAPSAPVVPVDGEPGSAEASASAAPEAVVEAGPVGETPAVAAEPEAVGVVEPVVPVAAEPGAAEAAAAEPVAPAGESEGGVDNEGTAKPVEDKNVKANLETAGVGEAGSEATEEAAGNPDEIKVVAKEDAEGNPIVEAGTEEAIGTPAEFDMPDNESETAIANRHMNEVADDLGRIDQVNAALEAYHGLLTQSITEHGVVPPAVARAIHIGLEAFGEATLTGLLPAVEDFAMSTTRTEASDRSVNAVEGKFKQMLEIARAAIKKLLEWLGNIWNGIFQDTGKMVAKLDDVKARVNAIKSTNPKPMMVNGVDRLSINGFFVGDTAAPIRVVNDTVEYFTQDYPKVFIAVVDAINAELKGALQGHEHASTLLQAAISDAVATKMKFPGLPSEKAKDSEIPSSIEKKSAVSRSKVFPGNMALFYALTTTDKAHFGADEHQTAAWKFSEIFQIQFARLADAKMMPTGGDGIKVPDARVLRQMCAEVAALIGTLEDLKDADKFSKEFSKKVEEMGRSWFSRNMGVAWMSFGQNMMNGLAKAYSTPSGNLFGYTASLVKAYLALIERFAEHHGAGAAGGATVNGSATRVEE